MAQAPDAYAQRLLAERARREAARKAAVSAPQRKPQIGMPSNLGQMVSRQPAPDGVGQVRQAITRGVDYAGNFLAQGRAPEIGGAVRSMVEPVAQFPVTAVTDPMRAANQAQQALDPAYAMARGLTTTRLGAQEGNLGDVAAGVTEMGLAGLSFVPGGAAVKGARSMPPAPVRRPPPIGQPNVLAPQASRGPILNQLAPKPKVETPKPLQKAQAEGYAGADIGEAQEWVRARSKGLDMSRPARMERAKELGFDTGTMLYHGTGADFTEFKPSTFGHFGPGIYLTDSPRTAAAFGDGEAQSIMPVYVGGKIATQQTHDFFLESALRETTNEPRAYEIAAKMMQKNGYAGFEVPPIENYSNSSTVILFNPSNIRSVNAAFDPAKSSSANILATPPELGGAFVGGALGGTQGETPQERAQNALLGAAGGAIGGRLARGAAIDRTRMGSNLGNVPKPVQKAQAEGYQGADVGEAQEWVSARSKGLDMSQPARMQRAQELGFDTQYKLFHATDSDFNQFDVEKIRSDLNLGEDAIFLTDSPAVADSYLGGAYVQRDAPKIIEKNVQGVDIGGGVGRYYSKNSAVYPLYAKNLNEYEVWDMGGGSYDPVFMQRAIKEAKENGAPGIILERVRDPGIMDTVGPQGNPRTPATVVAVFNPKDVRSVNAAFDPAKSSSANILAGVGAVGAGAAMMPREAEAQTVGSERRPDGTKKGLGYFGEIPITFPNGDTGVATEYSTQSQAVKVDGKMIDFPTLVPTLTPDEVRIMATDIIPNRKPIPETIMQKAIAHARKRLAAGQSVYADQKKPPGQRPRG